MTVPRSLVSTLAFSVLVASCGAPPAQKAPPSPSAKAKLVRRADLPDDCEVLPGKPAPEPLRIPYEGVARAARCQRAVYTIMGGLTHFLGVPCKHCHLEPDYAADTHNKQIANWMARELVPRLQRRVDTTSGSTDHQVWCQDCHAGKPKFLGDPRRRDFAIEWMTTHLGEDFETTTGNPPKCRDCHGGDLGSPEFKPKLILSELGGLPRPSPPAAAAPPAAASSAATASPPAPAVPIPVPAPSGSAVPDFGGR
ncbi:MAG TPA: cytochrome c3 family protein [Polyangiaceae bacterium]|nr:cytochrome c3 family protein [Polyangiaceae bacterium]